MWNSEEGRLAQNSGIGTSSQENKIRQTQGQVNEVIDVMKSNVNLVLERGGKISDLEERADNLDANAQRFQVTARNVKRKYWWKNMKMWLIIGVVVAVVITIIVLASMNWSGSSSSSPAVTKAPKT